MELLGNASVNVKRGIILLPFLTTRTLINSLGPEEAGRRSSVDKPWVPHDRLRNVSETLLALKVISPMFVGPLRVNVQAIDQRSRESVEA